MLSDVLLRRQLIIIYKLILLALVVSSMSPNLERTGVLEPQEESPLLRDGKSLRKETPLPITQILVLLLLQLSDPITSFSIRPYINQVRPSDLVKTVLSNICRSLSVSSQSLAEMKERSDITQG